MRVIHFSVRLGDIAAIQYSSCIGVSGEDDPRRRWNYGNAAEALSAAKIKRHVITAGEDTCRTNEETKQGVCVEARLQGGEGKSSGGLIWEKAVVITCMDL